MTTDALTPSASQRFTVERSHGTKKPWMVRDNASDPSEDAVLYFFASKRKADAFRSMLEDEKARGIQ